MNTPSPHERKEMFTREKWGEISAQVTREMTSFVRPFVTPISLAIEPSLGVAWGTGNYIKDGHGETWLLTADHVYTDSQGKGVLAHLPVSGDDYVPVVTEPSRAAYPVDTAAFQIPYDDKPDALNLDESRKLLISYFDAAFNVAERDLVFWVGYPGYYGERDDPVSELRLKVTRFGQLNANAKPFISQVPVGGPAVSSDAFDPALHVAIHYPSEGTSAEDGNTVPLPLAKGMSGSLLWDTKFVLALQRNEPWNPSMARVCGMLWGVLDEPKVVCVTKIEHIRSQLPDLFSL